MKLPSKLCILILLIFSLFQIKPVYPSHPLCFGVKRSYPEMRNRTANGWNGIAFGERLDAVQAIYCAGRSLSGNWPGCVYDIMRDGAKYFMAEREGHAQLLADFRKFGNRLEIDIGLSEPFCKRGSSGIKSIGWSPYLRWKRPSDPASDPNRYRPEFLGGYRHTNVQPRPESMESHHPGIMSEDECWRHCLENPKCNAMVHHTPTSGCYLKYGIVPPIPDWEHGTFHGVTIIPIRYNLGGVRHLNVQPKPESMPSLHPGVMSEKDCWEKCLKNSKCTAMVHDHSTFGCYLKTGPVPPIPDWEHGGTFRGVTIIPSR